MLINWPFHFLIGHLLEVFTECTVKYFNPWVFYFHHFYNLVHRVVGLLGLRVSEVIAKHQDNIVSTHSCPAVNSMVVNNVNKKLCIRHIIFVRVHCITAIKHFKLTRSRVVSDCFMNKNRFNSLIVCQQLWLPDELQSFLLVPPFLLQVKLHS